MQTIANLPPRQARLRQCRRPRTKHQQDRLQQMEIKDKVVVVTGGANGIGRSLCRRFAAEVARSVVVADVDIEGATTVADEIGGLAIEANVANEADIVRVVEQTTKAFGSIDLFCSNA